MRRLFLAGDNIPGFEEISAHGHNKQRPLVEGYSYLNPRIEELWRKTSKELVTRINPHTGLALKDDDKARAFALQLENVKPAPAVPEWERIAQEMQQLAQRAVHERQSALVMATELDARVDGFLEKRRWMLAQRARP